MLRWLIVLALAPCLVKPAAAQDLSSPEAAVRSLLSGFCNGDIVQAVNCVENGKYTPLLDPMAQAQKMNPLSYAIDSITSQVDGDRATVSLQMSLKPSVSPDVQSFSSIVKLHHLPGGWKIIALKEGRFVPGKPDPLNAAIRALAEPKQVTQSLEEDRKHLKEQTICTSNLTMVSTAASLLVKNHANRFAMTPANFEHVIGPYIRRREFFTCPADHKGSMSYAFNGLLQGLLATELKHPETLIVVYEGKAGKLHFRHDGKAGVVLADGNVKMVSEAEAKELRWAP